MFIDNYLAKLDELAGNLGIKVRDIVLDNKGQLLSTVKLRLYNKSLDANHNFLGPYSPVTIASKKKKGQISNRVTLRDTGNFYDAMFIDFSDGEIIVDSTDDKTDILKDIYGDAILGLHEDEVTHFVDTVLDPEIDKILNEQDLDLGW